MVKVFVLAFYLLSAPAQLQCEPPPASYTGCYHNCMCVPCTFS